MDKPCSKCSAYDTTREVCSILTSLQSFHLDKSDGSQEQDATLVRRAEHLDDLLIKRRCRFSLQVTHWARYFIKKRGLKLQDVSDVHNDVVASLLKLDFGVIEPTYDDFRRYVTTVTRATVNQEYIGIYGSYCCGNCAFYMEGSKRCGCPDLKPPPGQQCIHVNYSTKPKDVLHISMFLVTVDDILDWTVLCGRLSREGNMLAPSPSRRIWELLSTEMQEKLLATAQTNGVGAVFKFNLVAALNELLAKQDFYQERYFKGVTLTSEAEDILRRGRKGLSDEEARRLNRLLLEASFPQEIDHSQRGCTHYSSKKFVSIDELDSLVTLNENGLEDTFKYIETLGPRQRKLAKLLRAMLEGYKDEEDGYEIAELARLMGRHRTTIPKELNGTTEREKDERGKEIVYHQAGAIQVFLAIHTGALFVLRREEEPLWSVLSRRDFSSEAALPSFNKISGELAIPKREAIERYIKGWDQIMARAYKERRDHVQI